ncbi:MAG: DEAD/DEAH box helicase [Deltaproteobacteria bacterium]|nr:DEAD/DEAH box helicase [Deltaproteobacteria bacterium]
MSDTPETSTEVTPASDYVAEESFDQLPLSDSLRKGIAERGYTRPTPVQARALRPALGGKDLIVRSKTGTGKTAAFGIPVLERIDVSRKEPQALALCPTRELAIQVAEEVEKLGASKGVQVSAIYGGAAMGKQVDELAAGAQFIVGTPGRVYDHIRRKNLRLGNCKMAVLDEADEMLNQGFFEEVMRILEQLPGDRQTLLFSATVTPDIERLIKKFTKNPETILLSGDTYTVEGITNVFYELEDAYPKPRNLLYLLEKEQPESAIIFCNTRDDTSLVTAVLNRNGFDAELLNGDLPQKERERVMGKVKRGELQFMVATDIAARGIDISDLTHVINYSLPEDAAVYLHRVGRTGRIGRTGTAISIVSGAELSTRSVLEKKYGIKFEMRKMPSAEEAHKLWTDKHVKEIRDVASGSVFDAMLPMARELKGREDGEQIFAFLLKYFFQHHRMEKAQSAGTTTSEPERPAARKPEGRREREVREREERGPRRDRERRERPPRRPDTPVNGDAIANPPPGPESRSDEASSEPTGEHAGRRAKLWVNLGATDGLDANAVRSALLSLSGVDNAQILDIDLKATHSYAFVEPAAADALIAASGKEREGKPVRIEKPRRRR